MNQRGVDSGHTYTHTKAPEAHCAVQILFVHNLFSYIFIIYSYIYIYFWYVCIMCVLKPEQAKLFSVLYYHLKASIQQKCINCGNVRKQGNRSTRNKLYFFKPKNFKNTLKHKIMVYINLLLYKIVFWYAYIKYWNKLHFLSAKGTEGQPTTIFFSPLFTQGGWPFS